MRHQQRIGSM